VDAFLNLYRDIKESTLNIQKSKKEWLLDTINRHLENKEDIFFLSKSADEILAFADFQKKSDFIHVRQFVVHSDLSWQGYGTALLLELRKRYPELPLRGVVRKVNTSAINFYKKLNAGETPWMDEEYDKNLYVALEIPSLINTKERNSPLSNAEILYEIYKNSSDDILKNKIISSIVLISLLEHNSTTTAYEWVTSTFKVPAKEKN